MAYDPLAPFSFAAGLASPLVSGATTLASTALQHKYNKELADIQNKYNIDMWKMQADYNSPQAQMQRFSEAGLNPNLIYGQGSSGNMSEAPQLSAPAPVDIQGAGAKLAKEFNIQNLALNAFKIKEAKEQARIAELNRFDKEDERDALSRFGDLYQYDPESGRYIFSPTDVEVTANNPRGHRIGDRTIAGGLFTRYLGEHDPRMNYMKFQRDLMDPQIRMRNYDWNNYEKVFYLDRAKNSNFVGIGAALWHYITKYRKNLKNMFNF